MIIGRYSFKFKLLDEVDKGDKKMNVSTKQIIKGVITIEGNQVNTGISRSDLECILNTKIKVDSDHVGYVLGSELIFEDEQKVSFTVWFKNDTVRKIELNIGEFRYDDDAYNYLKEWLKERKLEWTGDSFYRTEFGFISPSLRRDIYGYFAINISLEYREIPSRKFLPIKENKRNTIKFVVDDSEYKVQRISLRELDVLPFLNNFIGDGPMSIRELNDTYSKDDRMETIYFMVSKIKNDVETIIGVADFTYFAVWEAYQNSELFFCLDELTEGWGIVGHVVQKYGCGLQNKNGITPYILVFETIHDEVPHNKELKMFNKDNENMKLLYNSALQLASNYVKIPHENMTLISLSRNKDSLFSNYKKVEDVFINYQRTEKVTI